MENNLTLNPAQLNKLFPFHIIINNNLQIVATGESLKKLYPNLVSQNFNETLLIKRPLFKTPNTITDLTLLENALTIIELNNSNKTILKGQFEFFDNYNKAIFFGTPFVQELETISAHNLVLNDFALHDSTIDFLHLLKANEIAKDDLTQLLLKLNNQQKELSNANKALFEQRKFYDIILNNTPADIVVFSPKHEYLFINPKAIKNDELRVWMIGKKDIDYLKLKNKPLNIATERAAIFNKAKKSKQLVGFEEKLITPSGDEQWMLRNFYPVTNDTNKVIYIIGYGIDISNIKKVEKELEASKKIAEASAHSKQVFLASMSHEIRTPLNIIFGLINQLTKTNIDSTQKYYLENVQSTSQHLLNVLNDILDLAQIESGKLTINNAPFNLKNTITQAKAVISYLAEEKEILINTSYDENISETLLGDSKRINQLLLNILSNAIKFTQKGCINIACNVVNKTITHQSIEIIIKDTGVGMNSNFTKKIFEKFSQENTAHNIQFVGSGLGMSICKEIVDLMQGKLSIESKVNVGTTVTILLDFAIVKTVKISPKESPVINVDCIKNKKIIIADDNAMNRKLVALILENYGAVITQVPNGLEVINHLQKQHFDVVLMDVEMPIMNGIQATLQIREILKNNIPIIALTAYAFKEDKKKFIAAGMNSYLSKPFNETNLIKILTEVLQNQPIKLKSANKKLLYYNLSQLEKSTRGNESLITELIDLFIQETQMALQEIDAATLLKDYEKIKKIIHKIKPSLTTMGVLRVIKKEVNYIEYTKQDDNAMMELVATVVNTLGIALAQLKNSFHMVLKNNNSSISSTI